MSIKIRADGILDPEGKYPNPLTGQPYSKAYLSLAPNWKKLKAWEASMKILAKIHKTSILLLILPTGTGKTVIIPKLLLHYFGYQKRVICTTPRKETTAGAGLYAAKCLDVPIYYTDDKGDEVKNPDAKGKESSLYPTGNKIVGYKHQGTGEKFFDPNQTMLYFATDGTIKAMIVDGGDIDLANYGGIIIDEAHERSVTIDIIIALVMNIIPRRPDFKVIIMSATIDEDFFVSYFKRINQGHNYSVFSLPNIKTNFKLTIVDSPQRVDPQLVADAVYKKVNEIMINPALPIGDILAFVTSESDITKVKQLLERNMSKYTANNKPYVVGFSANISENDKIIATGKNALKTVKPTQEAPQGYSRKIIIGTNAVESSITFGDPLVYVIEPGLAFEVKYNAKRYCIESGKNLVSQASITQRCGRTGRTNDGSCIRLYSIENFNKLPKYTEPKIRTEDFTSTLLEIIKLPFNGNLQKALEFINTRMIEPVKNYKDFIIRGYENLLNMGIIDTSGNLTSLGYVCSRFSIFDLKIIKMVIGGYYLGCLDMCVMLGAILTTARGYEDFFVKPIDILKNPKAKQQYDNNIKRFIHKSGDHITLLKIFYDFYMNPDKYKYTSDNGLNFKILSSVQKSYSDLIKQVTRNAQMIKALNLFSVPPEVLVFGGGKSKSEINNDNIDNFNNSNNMIGGDESEDSEDSLSDDSISENSESDESEDSESEDSETEEIEFKNNFKLHNKEDGDINATNATNVTNDTNDTNPIYRDYNKGIIQNIENDINLSNKNIRKHRKLSIKNIKGNKSKKLSTKYKKRQIGRKKRQLMSGGDDQQNNKNITDKVVNRRVKIMNLVELGNLQPRVMMPPNLLPDRILAALYYGFSINRACYTGAGKQYFVKSSPLKGSVGKTTFDYIEKMPDFIIYNNFNVMKTGGREDASLSIVSEISSKEFGQFLNLNDIKKKLD